ncbi:rhomboid family intramembrane serine protease [Neobacillus sp. LXY-4]|uniref:rhomboid family intramembrane serine protease n=1 Tax=Neobacillus sp. LXY-4 TaxID=3379826 RepID=UPI003EE40523
MNFQEDYLFWRLAELFISKHDYRLIQMKGNDHELWLENTSNKQGQIIRILRHNVDWSNWMQRDIEMTAAIGENFRRRFIRGELTIQNIYITPYPPVDDYQFRIEKPFVLPNSKKTRVCTTMLMPNELEKSLQELSAILGFPIEVTLDGEYNEQDIQTIKQLTLAHTVMMAKKEKAIFENGKPLFTYVFLVIQIGILMIMEFMGGSTNSSTLIQFGAKFNPLILEGEWWRFFTPMFLHIGFLHLLMNSIALFYMGPLVERIFGSFRFVLIYLFAGFAGSVASFAFSPNLSAGASGAIFGCFGALLYFGVIYPKLFFRTMGMNILFVIGLNLVFGFSMNNIDNAGHIGGLIGGFLAAGVLHFPKAKKPVSQLMFTVMSSILVFILLQYGFGESTRAIDTHSSFVLAQLYVEKEDYDGAYEVLKEVQNRGENSADLLFLMSYVEIQKGLTTQAKQHLFEVIKMDANFEEAYYNLALLYLNENNLEKAKEHASKALKLDPTRSDYKDLVKEINQYLLQKSIHENSN